jgi:hypothetical protein
VVADLGGSVGACVGGVVIPLGDGVDVIENRSRGL